MFHICGKLPANNFAVAVSGGPDSMAVLDFLRRTRKPLAVHYNHGTQHAKQAEALVREYCRTQDIPLLVGYLDETAPPGVSMEQFWRLKRYKFFDKVDVSKIITCHTLDDQVEQWLMTSLWGQPRLIPLVNGKYIRPFVLNPKSEFLRWCQVKHVPYVQDPSNYDSSYKRSYVRKHLVPRALEFNPGLYTTIRNKVKELPSYLERANVSR